MSTENKFRKREASKEKYLRTTKGSKIIRLPISEELYPLVVEEPQKFRGWLDGLEQKYKDLFGIDIAQGYYLHDIRYSKKLDMYYRRIRIGQSVYSIEPSFVMPYFSGWVKDCKDGLLLYFRGSSLDSLVVCYGDNQQKWLNRVHHLGRFSIVGTTVKSKEKLPTDLSADEKITFLNGEEVYACVTTGNDCILGASLSLTEDEAGLSQHYGIFKEEAHQLCPHYQPNSVNTDGWAATRKSWLGLFENIHLILCFLHSYIKMRNIAQKEAQKMELFHQLWQAYKAATKMEFISKIQALQQWANTYIQSQTVLKQVDKLVQKTELFATAYDCKGNRTSNMVDRAIKTMNKFLENTQYFHGNYASAQLTIRALALAYNFLPFCQRTKNDKKNSISYVELLI